MEPLDAISMPNRIGEKSCISRFFTHRTVGPCNLLQVKGKIVACNIPLSSRGFEGGGGNTNSIAIVSLFLSYAGLLLPAFYIYASHDEPEHQGCFRAEAYDLDGD